MEQRGNIENQDVMAQLDAHYDEMGKTYEDLESKLIALRGAMNYNRQLKGELLRQAAVVNTGDEEE